MLKQISEYFMLKIVTSKIYMKGKILKSLDKRKIFGTIDKILQYLSKSFEIICQIELIRKRIFLKWS